MARVKDWLIEMESTVGEALDRGLRDHMEIIKFCKKCIGNIDEQYIRECIRQYEWGY